MQEKEIETNYRLNNSVKESFVSLIQDIRTHRQEISEFPVTKERWNKFRKSDPYHPIFLLKPATFKILILSNLNPSQLSKPLEGASNCKKKKKNINSKHTHFAEKNSSRRNIYLSKFLAQVRNILYPGSPYLLHLKLQDW